MESSEKVLEKIRRTGSEKKLRKHSVAKDRKIVGRREWVKVKGNGGRVNSTGCGRKAAKLSEKARVGNVSDLL